MAVDGLQDQRLRFAVWMNAVFLKQGAIGGESVEHERNQRCLVARTDFPEQCMELFRVIAPVVGWNAYADEQRLCAVFLARFDDGGQVFTDDRYTYASQTVVGTQFDNHDLRLMAIEQGLDSPPAPGGGFAADTRIDNTGITVRCSEPGFKQADPAAAGRQSISR